MAEKEEEGEDNNGMQRYYLASFLLFTSLGVQCLLFFLTYGGHTCMMVDEIATMSLESAAASGEDVAATDEVVADEAAADEEPATEEAVAEEEPVEGARLLKEINFDYLY